jgi:hypothetical protein
MDTDEPSCDASPHPCFTFPHLGQYYAPPPCLEKEQPRAACAALADLAIRSREIGSCLFSYAYRPGYLLQ